MNKKLNLERGQALILVAFAIIGLIAITGLAIDGGMAFSDRRNAQNAADTAALAGALAKINAQLPLAEGGLGWNELQARAPMRVAALERAESNGYSNTFPGGKLGTVQVYNCDEVEATCDYPYAGSKEYLQVIISSDVDTFFAKVIGVPQVHNRVEAIARADDDDSGPLANGEAIVALRTDCKEPASFYVGGSAIVNLTGGGLFINSTDPECGFKCETSAGSITGSITTAGGEIDMSAACTLGHTGTKSQTGSPVDYPITLDDVGLKVPEECTSPKGEYTNWPAGTNFNGTTYTDPITVLSPGWYTKFPPDKDQPLGKLNDTIVLESGTYCVGDVIRWNVPAFKLIGEDITLFVRAGYDFSFTGGDIIIDAPDSGDYAGYLIIVEPNYSYTDGTLDAPTTACTINGDTHNDYTGTIFAPYCSCTLNGGSEPSGFNAQLLCYDVSVDGSSIINFTYDPGKQGQKIDPPNTGLAR